MKTIELTLGQLVEMDGLRPGETVRLVGGRTKYVEVGSMWRERSDLQCYVSIDGSYNRRRYLPDDTMLILEAP
jgi:hypothetical protein